jgi:DNA-binding response OmpR family regulator
MRGTVVVVEDDRVIRESMQTLLEDEGYRVLSAGGGREALKLLRSVAPPSMVLVDLMMPDVSGWDLIQEMHADARLSSVPIVIISAMGKALTPVAGVADILHKPFGARRLLSAVVQHSRVS